MASGTLEKNLEFGHRVGIEIECRACPIDQDLEFF
jgi:hypothetical protein